MKVKQLQEEMAALLETRRSIASQARDIMDRSADPKEGDEARHTELCDKSDRLEADITEKQNEIIAELRTLEAEKEIQIPGLGINPEDVQGDDLGGDENRAGNTKRQDRISMLDSFLRGHVSAMEIRRDEREHIKNLLHAEGGLGLRSGELLAERRASLTKGSDVVGVQPFGGLVLERQDFDGVRKAGANVITTTGGNRMTYNRYPTAAKAVIVAEGVSNTTDSTPAKTAINLDVFMYRSLWHTVTFEMLDDADYDVLGTFTDFVEESIGRGIAEHFTTGSGSGQPQGIMTGATVGVTAAAQAAITADEIEDLYRSVDPAYRIRAAWMAADGTVGAIKKLKDSQGRHLWTAAFGATPELINGHRVQVNNECAALAASAKTVAFGDFNLAYVIRDVSGMRIIRDESKEFTNEGKIGMQAFARHGGVVLNPAAVKTLQQAA